MQISAHYRLSVYTSNVLFSVKTVLSRCIICVVKMLSQVTILLNCMMLQSFNSRGVWRAPVQYSSIQYRQGYVHCGKQKSKIPLPRLLPFVFLHLPFVKTPRSVTVLDRQEASCSSGSMIQLCMGTLPAFRPLSIKVSLPSLYPQCHSRDKISQAFHAFRTTSDKSCAEAWERGYGYPTLQKHSLKPRPSMHFFFRSRGKNR